MAQIEIDGIKLQAEQGTMLIEAADSAGIHIPRFCYHKKLSVAANCRLCLVEVENARGPVPACATPVTDGMKVKTKSTVAREAQKSVMEFLLINHPLDCPVCDQGGECELQDMAMGYGNDVSRFCEGKRAVKDKNIGPLIATAMTRCIHCTRCVRFGTEVAGIRELGATGRGENMQIGTYIEKSVDSEMSGNIIDLCPVGALTSKPFQFQARAWELTQSPSIAPHDCAGSNVYLHSRRQKLLRVVPKENEQVNECWISDRDRFSYQAVYSDKRLAAPKIRQQKDWIDVDWQTALNYVVEAVQKVQAAQGADSMAALCSPSASTEELFLLQKLWRSLGAEVIEHRLRHQDLSSVAEPQFPKLSIALADIDTVECALVLGTRLRKQQPIINTRLHKAVTHHDAQVFMLHAQQATQTFPAQQMLCAPHLYVSALWQIARALHKHTGHALPALAKIPQQTPLDADWVQALAAELLSRDQSVIWLGSEMLSHPQLGLLRQLSQWIAEVTHSHYGELSYGCNSVGAYMAGALPHRLPGGNINPNQSVVNVWYRGYKLYFLYGFEPDLDVLSSARLQQQLQDADLVVAFTSVQNSWLDQYAHVQLPLSSFAENEGSYINCSGDWQHFKAAIPPVADSKPGWKILRVLANLFELDGFDYQAIEDVSTEIQQQQALPYSNTQAWSAAADALESAPLSLMLEWPIYHGDCWVRRANALQHTRDALDSFQVVVSSGTAIAHQLKQGDLVQVSLGATQFKASLSVSADQADQAIYIPLGMAQTVALALDSDEIQLRQVKG